MDRVKRVVKSIANRFGYDIVQHVESCERPFDVLGLVVRGHLARDPGFFFVQVGAGDGIQSDPLRPFGCQQMLLGHGYRFIDVGMDTLAVHEVGQP